jgi:DNA-binding MarR family transcriptional regulator
LVSRNGGFLVSQIKQLGGRIFDRILVESKIDAFNGAQGRILYVLWQSDSIPIIELSRKTGLANTTLTSMLDRMEASGLIEREYDPKDRRKIQIKLAKKAREYRTAYDRVSKKMIDIYYEGFTDDEINEFEEYLTRVLDNLRRSRYNE